MFYHHPITGFFLESGKTTVDKRCGSCKWVWLQHDGEPQHFTWEVTELLNENFKGLWIRRGGPKTWPNQSSNLIPLDSFLWGWMKLRVCQVGKPEGSHQLLKAIKEVAVGTRSELGIMQWQYSGPQCLAVCLRSILAILSIFWNNLETSCKCWNYYKNMSL